MVEEWLVEVEVRPTIVTEASVRFVGWMGTVSQYSHSITTPHMISLCVLETLRDLPTFVHRTNLRCQLTEGEWSVEEAGSGCHSIPVIPVIATFIPDGTGKSNRLEGH